MVFFIKSDLYSNWAAILHLNESIMITKAHHSKEQMEKKAREKHLEASMEKIIQAASRKEN